MGAGGVHGVCGPGSLEARSLTREKGAAGNRKQNWGLWPHWRAWTLVLMSAWEQAEHSTVQGT